MHVVDIQRRGTTALRANLKEVAARAELACRATPREYIVTNRQRAIGHADDARIRNAGAGDVGAQWVDHRRGRDSRGAVVKRDLEEGRAARH